MRSKAPNEKSTSNLAHSQTDVAEWIAIATQRRQRLLSELRTQPSGRAWCKKNSAIADATLRRLFEAASAVVRDAPEVAVVAVGGYGRRELAPRSDIDVTFIPKDEHDDRNESFVRELFKLLIEVFGKLDWRLGYAYRLASDAPALDANTRTGLLDARLVCGSRTALENFQLRFASTFPIADFLISKFEERRAMRERYHDTPYVVEFHLRDGAGGLRDAQTTRWCKQVLGRRTNLAQQAAQDYELLLTTRNVLHLVTERKEDTLVRTRRSEVAAVMGLSASELSDGLMSAGARIESLWMDAQRDVKSSSFPLSAGAVARCGQCLVLPGASLADAAVGVSRAVRLGLHISQGPIPASPGDLPRVIEHLVGGEEVVRGLDRAGLLDQLLPEFAPCRRLVSQDSAHRYSVGEHSIRVLSALDASRRVEEFAGPWSEVSNVRPLYLAALLHDVGKATGEVSHSEAGAAVAERVCERFGVAGDERESTVWLVRNHLVMGEFARTHDLGHPATFLQFARLCGRADRLAMLYLLTFADISSLNEDAWTPQLASFCSVLYERSRAALGIHETAQDAIFRTEAVRRLQSVSPGESGVAELLKTMPAHYLLATPVELFPTHAEYVRRAKKGETVVSVQHQRDSHTTDITICVRDLPKPGLLSRILGIIYAHDLTIHSARAASTVGPEPIALDTISASFRGHELPASLCNQVAKEMRDSLHSQEMVDAILRQRGKDPERKQTMLTYHFHEGKPGVLEIETPTGRGMPYRVAKMLAGFGWNVHVARIGQWADRAVARFYIDLPGGSAVTRQMVDAALSPGVAADAV